MCQCSVWQQWCWGSYREAGGSSRITLLAVRPALAGSTIRISCTGRGCPFRVKTRKVRRNARQLSLTTMIRRARLRHGARMEIRVTKPEMIGSVLRLKVLAGGRIRRADLCLPPGAKAPRPCRL